MNLLAFLLLLPWFIVLGTLYWLWPIKAKRKYSRLFDILMLLLAAMFSVTAMFLGLSTADTGCGDLWPQILASLFAYKAFLLVLAAAVWLQRRG
jgi:hypothetical protein